MRRILNSLKLNDDASSGGLAGLVLNFVFFSFICIILAKVMDRLIILNNSFIGSFNMSGDAVNSLTTISFIFTILPIIYLVFLVINHIVISNRDSTGEA
jgi:hypothetical protein